MTTTSQTWTEQMVELAGARIQLIKGGSGNPLLIFHDEMGHPGWLRFHEALAQRHTLYIPAHPGYGKSPFLDWVMNMRDLAGWYLEALDDLDLGPVDAIGFSLGGWLAAEMAAMCPHNFKKLALVAPTGIKPPVGEIFDMFQVVARNYITAQFASPQRTPEFAQVCPDQPSPELLDFWEDAKETSCRLSWRPYMHYPGLPHLLHRLKRLPTLIIWGRDDQIVPVSAGQAYRDAIPGSRLVTLDNCGHRPELEQTDQFVRLVQEFLGGS